MPFIEKTLALANTCLARHVMGICFTILKELSYENILNFWEFIFAEFTHNTNTHIIVTETCCK